MFDMGSVVSRLSYILTVFFNSTLIYLTVYHTKEIVGTYRNMIVTFASIGIVFSTLDILVRPMFHSYNGCLLFFTLHNTFQPFKSIAEISLLIYCGMYGVILAFLTVQFMYRACVLSRPKWTKHFGGWKIGLWLVYSVAIGSVWSITTSLLVVDDYVQGYLGDEILKRYGKRIESVPGFAILAYNGPLSIANIRWNSVICLFGETIAMTTQYLIMVFSGISMYQNIKKNINTNSTYYSNLQKQFFMTLVYQVSAPSLIFHAPAFILLYSPFLDFKFSFHSQIVLYCFSVYPLVDTLIVLYVISEYRNSLKSIYRGIKRSCYGRPRRPPASDNSLAALQI